MNKEVDPDFDEYKEQELVTWLDRQIGQENFRPGFLRLQKMVEDYRVECERRNIFIITIGGTNGKGETSHTLNFLLQQHGYSCALWTSPHVRSVRERIRIHGQNISYSHLWECLHRCHLKLNDYGIGETTYYEFMLMVFMDALITAPGRPVDVCILEVGLGGRLDGVNFFNPHLTAITSISRDHEKILGKGYRNILQEKLGITRSRVPLLTALELNYCRQQVEDYTKDKSIPWIDLFEQGICQLEDHYSHRNQLLSLSLMKMFTLQRAPLKKELLGLKIPCTRGRGEWLHWQEKEIFCVGAHNTDGMRKLRQALITDAIDLPYDLVLMSFSNRPLDEIKVLIQMMESLIQPVKQIMVTHFQHPKAIDWEQLSTLCSVFPVGRVQFTASWQKSQLFQQSKRVLVTGSYYFIGELQHCLQVQ